MSYSTTIPVRRVIVDLNDKRASVLIETNLPKHSPVRAPAEYISIQFSIWSKKLTKDRVMIYLHKHMNLALNEWQIEWIV